MANATKTEAVVEVIKPEGITLELTMDEAQALTAILGEFSNSSPATSVYSALIRYCDNDNYYVSQHNSTRQVSALVLRDRNEKPDPW